MAGVTQRTVYRLRRAGRREARPAAAALLRQPPARRPPEPRHQRHRQHRPDAPAEPDPAHHLGPDHRRRADHDAHDQPAAGRHLAARRAGVARRDASSSRGRSQKQFVAQWASTGRSTATSRRCTPGHAIVKVFGRQQEAIDAVRRARTSALYQASYRAQFISGHHPARDEVRLEPQLRRDRVIGGLRVATGQMSPRRRHRVHPVLAPVHVPDHPDGLDRQRPPVGGRLGGAGVRAARRGRGDRRPGRAGALPGAPAARVAFEDVSFRYVPDMPLIDDLDLVVEPGQTVAIVGPTGAGKTTLVNLLMRFYEVDGGPDHGRRRRHPGADAATTCAARSGWSSRTRGCSTARSARTSPTARDGATEERDPRGRRGGPRGPLRAHAARRLRHGHRRRRDQPLGGREAAAHDRARVPRRPADPDPRRGDLIGRHAHRGADPARDGAADARAGRRS